MSSPDDPVSEVFHGQSCKDEATTAQIYRARLEHVAEDIIRDCSAQECHTHIGFEPIPSRLAVVEIIDTVREHRDVDAGRVLEGLLGRVREFTRGAPQNDDVTAIVIRYRG